MVTRTQSRARTQTHTGIQTHTHTNNTSPYYITQCNKTDCACVRACVCIYVGAFVRACVYVCVCVLILEEKSTYVYSFGHHFPYVARPDWLEGAAHGDDLPFVFGLPDSMTEAFNLTYARAASQWRFAEVLMTYWSNFAKTGCVHGSVSPPQQSLSFFFSLFRLVNFPERRSPSLTA